MKILYLDPMHGEEPISGLLTQCGHEVTCVADPNEAFDVIRAQNFGAALIAGQSKNSETCDFIFWLHGDQPGLLVFALSVWGSELMEIIETMDAIEKSGQVPDA